MHRRNFLKLAGGTLIATPFVSAADMVGREAIEPKPLPNSLEVAEVGRVRLVRDYDLVWDAYIHRIDVLVEADLYGIDFRINHDEYKKQLEGSEDYYQPPLIELAKYLKSKKVYSLADCDPLPHHGSSHFVAYLDNELARYF